MRRVPFLLVCMLFQLLTGTVKALNAAGGAELTFFYQAYLVERKHVTDPTRRNIAPECHINKEKPECSFADFVDYVSSDDARKRNRAKWSQFREIFESAGDTPLVETSKKPQADEFRAEYDQKRIYPKVTENSVTDTIRGMRNIVMTTKKNQYPDQKRKMIEALELVCELRQADNMKYFIPVLERAAGVILETKPATTSDGMSYKTYDVDATAEKNKGVKDLAQKIDTAAEALRKKKSGSNNDERRFVTHQRLMRESKDSIKELRKKCP